jgi:hypothetical protein
MSGGDETYSNTRVSIVKRMGACGYVLSCLASNGAAFGGPSSRGTYPVLETP